MPWQVMRWEAWGGIWTVATADLAGVLLSAHTPSAWPCSPSMCSFLPRPVGSPQMELVHFHCLMRRRSDLRKGQLFRASRRKKCIFLWFLDTTQPAFYQNGKNYKMIINTWCIFKHCSRIYIATVFSEGNLAVILKYFQCTYTSLY